jgi:PAS domain S-box-containing protein
LIDKIDHYLGAMKENEKSVYYKSISRHIGGLGREKHILPKWVKVCLVIAGIIITIFLVKGAILKFKINIKIKELEKEYLDRREVSRKLSKSESKFSKFFHDLPVPAFIIDINGYFTEINSAFIEKTGYSQSDIVGKSIFEPMEMFSVTSKGRIMDNFRRRINKEDVEAYTIKFKTQDGTKKYFNITAITIFKNNDIAEVIGVATDITDKVGSG